MELYIFVSAASGKGKSGGKGGKAKSSGKKKKGKSAQY